MQIYSELNKRDEWNFYPESESLLQACWNLTLAYENVLRLGHPHESVSLLVSRKLV